MPDQRHVILVTDPLGAVTGSQKGLMLPAGLSFVALSGVGWKRAEEADQH